MKKKVTTADILFGVARRLERYYICKRWPLYVYKKELKRQGQCSRCGGCCKYLLRRCEFLRYDKDKKAICLIYPLRSKQCKAFPINQRDVDEIGKWGVKCGFYFSKGEYL